MMVHTTRFLKKHFFRPFAFTLLFLFIVSALWGTNPNKAMAFWGIGDTVIVVEDIPHEIKEIAADGAAWALTNTLIAAMGDSVVQWINSGFQGDPLFVSNPEAFFLDVANEVSGQFIAELGLGAICEPFRPQITIALAQQESFLQRSQCTFLDGVANVEAFIDDFNAGGWQGWISLTQQQQNNPYGAYFIAVDERNRRLAEAEQNAREEVSQNQGFLSVKRCVLRSDNLDQFGAGPHGAARSPYPEVEAGTGNVAEPEGSCLRWETQTPGQAIVGSLNETLGSPLDRLGEADEISEAVISAIMNALINQMVLGGLRSLSGGDGNEENNLYISATNEDANALLEDIDAVIAENESILNSGTKMNELMAVYDELYACREDQVYAAQHPELNAPDGYLAPSIEDLRAIQQQILDDKAEAGQLAMQGTKAQKAGESIGKLQELRDRIEQAKQNGNLTPQSIAEFSQEFEQIKQEVDLLDRGQDLQRVDAVEDELVRRKRQLENCKNELAYLQSFIGREDPPVKVEVINFPGGSEEESSE